MRRYSAGLFLASVLVVGVPLAVNSQQAQLTILNSGPTGEINQLQDANEIRVIFSEPMVALGRVPSNPTPPWIHIAPAIPGTFRWSGTTILIFTPDPATPLPYATRTRVTDRRERDERGRTPARQRRTSSRSRRRRSSSRPRVGTGAASASTRRC